MGRFSRPSLAPGGLDVRTQPEPAWRLPFHPHPPHLPGARQPGPKSLSPSGPPEWPARRNRAPPSSRPSCTWKEIEVETFGEGA